MPVDEWNCSKCTFRHKYPAQRCQMCSALRVSKQQMRDFVAGGGNSNTNIKHQQGGSSRNDNGGSSSVVMNNNDNNAVVANNNAAVNINQRDNIRGGMISSSSSSLGAQRTAATTTMPPPRPRSAVAGKGGGPMINNPYAKQQQQQQQQTSPSKVIANPYDNSRLSSSSRHSRDVQYPNHNNNYSSNMMQQKNNAPVNQMQQQNNTSFAPPKTATATNNAAGHPQRHLQQQSSSSSIRNPYANNNTKASLPQIGRTNSNAQNQLSSSVSTMQQRPNSSSSSSSIMQQHYPAQSRGASMGESDRSMSGPDHSNDQPNNQQKQIHTSSQHTASSHQPNNPTSNRMGQQQQQQQQKHSSKNNVNTSSNQQNNNNSVNLHRFFSSNNPQQQQQQNQKSSSSVAAAASSTTTNARQNNHQASSSGSFQQQQRSLKSMYTKEKPYKPGPIPQCTTTNDNWIYPIDDKYPERSYQLQMSHSAIMQNTLVSLPTGLGKTLIAAVVMYNYYRWFPTGKIVFCAPTRPLVSQQILACYKIMGIPEQHTAEISGRSKPDSRTVMWRNKRVFFCTPQTLVKDIQDDRCDASSIVCVVMDEAHRATGEHANSVLVRLIDDSGAKYRLVGLSATPGADIKSIQAILDTLHISRIEARTEDDPNVSKYVHQTEEEVIVVKQPDVVKALDTKFSELIVPILTRLREEKVSQRLHYDSATLKPWSVIQAQKEYVSRTGDHRLDGQFNILRELVNSRAILKEHGVQMARQKLAEASHKQYMNYITRTAPFQSLMRDMMIVASGASQEEVEATTDTFENNPKLSKLVEVLTEHFERKRAINESTRVIVFSQWRESVNGIVKMLEFQNSTLIKPAQFIGQASKKAAGTKSKTKKKNGSSSTSNNYSTGQDAAGMNQAQQQRVLQQFGEGVYNVLVCTCVAEEGLDVSVMVY